MEIMYSNKNYDIFKDNIIGVYGDKVDFINLGVDFDGIVYDDDWSVKRFLNGFNFKINNNILELFSELEISYSLLKKKIKELSKGQLKLILLVYMLINKKNILVLDYFDKGLSYKYKKRIINYLKTKYDGKIIVISNDIVFLNMLCKKLMVFENGELIFDDDFDKLYNSKIKLAYPDIINFIRIANKKKAKLSYTVYNQELLKDIYRSVR